MPVYAFSRHEPIKLFDALTATSDTKSVGYAVPHPRDGHSGRTVVWQSIMNVDPSAISLALQGAMNDVEAEYRDLDTSTVVTGDLKTVLNVGVRFLRVRQVSRTGGTSVTVQVMVQ